jgi:hydroxymethylglutaryl-CoA synthase
MTNVGITAYGIYLPWYRLSRKVISAALGALSGGSQPGEKTVANHDEDSLTMAVSAARDCLKSIGQDRVTGLLFASTTAPYRERESATIISTALNWGAGVRTADICNSLRAGTTALMSACEMVSAGTDRVLVCAAESRLGKPGSNEEMTLGDGAASFMLGKEGVIAELGGQYVAAHDFPDYRRLPQDKYVRSTEERFIREEGFSKMIPQAVTGLLKKYKLEARDFAKVAFPCTNAREHAAIAKRLGFAPEQVQPLLLASVGETGAASPLILLVAMLEQARPGDNILLVGYGSGAEALYFKVTEGITKVKDRSRLKKAVETKQNLISYEKYLIFRGILPMAKLDEDVPRTQLPLAWRERGTILALVGSRCRRCGTPQYPPQRVCVNPSCGAIDEMESFGFADQKAALFSFTEDHASPFINPPLIYGMVDFEVGGRFPFDLTDCEMGTVKTGMPLEMVLRRKYVDELRSVVGYFWKARPAR